MTRSRLKFDPKASDEGLYFVADAAGETPDWGLWIADFGLMRSVSPVHVAVPAVQSAIGLVRARMGSGTSARELRIGRLDSTLTVLPT